MTALKAFLGALAWVMVFAPVPAVAEETAVRAYVWGNSLIKHDTNFGDTTVPHWLGLLAKADGRALRLSGQSAFGAQFPDKVPPEPNWSFEPVTQLLDSAEEFAGSGVDSILINPENFVQYRDPGLPYEGDNPDRRSPVSSTVALLEWVRAQGVQPTVFLYEGWAEMDSFPPTRRAYRRYLRYTLNQYHVWYRAYREMVAAKIPGMDVRLVPVGSILSKLIDAGPLSDLRPTDLYSDNAPHGTATTYLIAAMITYAALYDAPPPEGFALFDGVHDALASRYDEVSGFIWQEMQGFTGPRAALDPVRESVEPEVQAVVAEASAAAVAPEEVVAEVLPAPEVAEATGLGNPSVAMGLNGIADWSTQHPFIDIMKTARPWVGHLPGQWGGWTDDDLEVGGYLDENGWVIRIPEELDRIETFVLTDQPEAATGLAARYRVTWKGAGRIDVIGRAKVQRRDPETNSLWFRFAPGDGPVAIVLQETDPQETGDHIRDIAVVREDHVPLFEAGAVFSPEFIARVQDLRSLRFMDWMFTNNSTVEHWEQRAQVADFTYGRRGVPVEVMVDLANFVGADPWFNMPHMADDAYVRQFAALVQARLDPRLVTYVEYSNEIWNRVFHQSDWAVQQAEARWGSEVETDAWMQFAGMRAAEVADIWAEVYGGEAAARLVQVIAVHTGWPGLEKPLLEAPLWQAEGAMAPAARFQAYAVTGYFGHRLGSDKLAPVVQAMISEAEATATASGESRGLRRVALREHVRAHRFDTAIEPVIAMLRKGSVKHLIEELWPYHAAVARAHDMTLVMYEGGTHVAGHGAFQDDERLTAFFHELNYSPEMGAIYAELLTAWRAAGGAMFNAFVDVVNPTKYGSWGNLRHLQDSTPRWDALMAFNGRNPGWWEQRRRDAFLHGVIRYGGKGGDTLEGTTEEDILIGLEGDDVLVSKGRADHLHGGPGQDIAVLPGSYADYGFDAVDSVVRAWHPQGNIVMRDIELVRFGDGVEVRTELLH